MYAALQTDDILREIFDNLRANYVGRKRDTSTLYRAALTCKQFLPHALDALWYSMETLEPLLYLVPDSNVSWDYNSTMSVTELLRADDLSTFDTYAHRIWRYHPNARDYTHHLRTPVMLELLEGLGRRFLLPNLRYLEINIDVEISDTYCFLLSPTLEEIEIRSTCESDQELIFFFPHLVRTVPSLRSLAMPDGAPIPEHLLHLTRHFTKLQTLDTSNNFEISVNSFLSKFPFAPYLTALGAASIAIIEKDKPLIGKRRSGGPIIQFPALKTLVLRSIELDTKAASYVFTTTLFPNLQDLTLHAWPCHEDSDDSYAVYKRTWSHIFSSVLSGKVHLQSLTVLHDLSFGIRPSGDMGMNLSRLLEHATYPQPLSSLSIETPLLLPLEDTSIHSLAKTFPHLTHLSLIPKLNTSSAMITFQKLALLAQLLPKLSTLHICIDGTQDFGPSNIPLPLHRLEMLSMGRSSKIGNPSLFGQHIAKIFPFATLDTSLGSLPPKGHHVISAFSMMKRWREYEYERRFGPH